MNAAKEAVGEQRHAVKNHPQIAYLTDTRRPIRLGFVPLTDCAPLAVAHEKGLFQKYGLRVTLHRELGWASIRDKVIYGELEAAHALAAMPLAATLGIGSIQCDCLSALILNLHGNAITLSADLWRRGVKDGATLRQEIANWRAPRPCTLGAVFPFSSHRHLLRQWLAQHGITPDRDVRIAIVPPPQMVAHLAAGHLDGFCVGEPWNAVASLSRIGWRAATSAELNPGHPEKVLMVRRQFAEVRGEEHAALMAALIEACEFCDAPENRDYLVSTLARPEYVNAPLAALRNSFDGVGVSADGSRRAVQDYCVFFRGGANEPSADKVAWTLELVRASGLCPELTSVDVALGRRVFRPDLYDRAVRLRSSRSTDNPYESRLEHQLASA